MNRPELGAERALIERVDLIEHAAVARLLPDTSLSTVKTSTSKRCKNDAGACPSKDIKEQKKGNPSACCTAKNFT